MSTNRIICWGDSITIGMGMARNECYPAVLQGLVGNSYKVINAGSSGERSHTIAARQGAYEVFLDKDIVFGAGFRSVEIGVDNDHSMIIADGTKLDINKDGEAWIINDLPCNKIYIDGKEFELTVSQGKFHLLREEYKKSLTLKKGAQVVFLSAKNQKGSYCEIFYVGANDGISGTQEDIEYLINRYKAMIERQGSGSYIVIIPQWSSSFTKALKERFGENAVDLRTEICSRIIESNGYNSTETDIKEAKTGNIPTSLKFDNNPNDSLHLNQDGYKMMAEIIYDNGVKLGYWK